jgi:hypothetical protein
MKMPVALALFGLVAAPACTTDEKGASCDALSSYTTGDGETYCPDESAPDDCRAFTDTLVRRAAECSNGAFTEEELRAEFESREESLDCDTAVATTVRFDDCLSGIEDDAFCDGAGSFTRPAACEGAILTDTTG